MLTEDVFYLARIDVESARDDHVLGAIDDSQEATWIAYRHVARM